MPTPADPGRLLDERNALIDLIEGRKTWLPGYSKVTDSGYDFVKEQGEFVYEINGARFEVTVKRLA